MSISEAINSELITPPLVEEYIDLSCGKVEPSVYFFISQKNWRVYECVEEADEEEILRFVEQSGYFDFLSCQDEDIYSLEDGKPL